jgi:hypothetical protein
MKQMSPHQDKVYSNRFSGETTEAVTANEISYRLV